MSVCIFPFLVITSSSIQRGFVGHTHTTPHHTRHQPTPTPLSLHHHHHHHPSSSPRLASPHPDHNLSIQSTNITNITRVAPFFPPPGVANLCIFQVHSSREMCLRHPAAIVSGILVFVVEKYRFGCPRSNRPTTVLNVDISIPGICGRRR